MTMTSLSAAVAIASLAVSSSVSAATYTMNIDYLGAAFGGDTDLSAGGYFYGYFDADPVRGKYEDIVSAVLHVSFTDDHEGDDYDFYPVLTEGYSSSDGVNAYRTEYSGFYNEPESAVITAGYSGQSALAEFSYAEVFNYVTGPIYDGSQDGVNYYTYSSMDASGYGSLVLGGGETHGSNIFSTSLVLDQAAILHLDDVGYMDYSVYIASGDWHSVSFQLDFEVVQASEVPVPSAIWLLGSGMLGLVGVARRRAKLGW
jgi:hypothetical protein